MGLVLFCRRAVHGAGRVGPEGMSLEGCLTISSEERETWTAVSLRVSLCASAEGPKRPLTVTFQTTIPFGSGLAQRRETVGWMAAGKGVCLELVKDKLGNVAQAVSLAR